MSVKFLMALELYDKHVPSVENGLVIHAENEMSHYVYETNNGPDCNSIICAFHTGITS